MVAVYLALALIGARGEPVEPRALVVREAQDERTLSNAVLYGQTQAVESLIASGADVNAMDATGMTPLMVAASQGRTGIARMLIAAGADVKTASEDGTTALMRAASANRVDVLRLLLAHGADVNGRNHGGMTALMVAAFGGYAECVRALVASHADVNAKDNQGRTALMAAARSGDGPAVQALLAGGADLRAADAGGFTAVTYAAAEGETEVLDAMLKRGVKPGNTELMLAASGCHLAAARFVLTSGVTANGVDGFTPLVAAAGENCADVVQLLLDRGADLNAKDHDGSTALIKAAAAGYTDIVRLLLERGADMNVADNTGRRAWTYAAMAGHVDAADLFKRARGTASQTPSDAIEVSSPTLKADQPMPKDYTADGRNMSPPLAWSNLPAGTTSIAVVCEDPDAGNPPPFVHWVIYNIPPSAKGLPENIPFEPDVPMPSEIAGAIQGVSGFRRPIYRGPAPPPGKPHHYHFVVYALDSPPDLKPGLNRADLLAAIKGHVIGQGELMAIYER